jgi:hypothetical protein
VFADVTQARRLRFAGFILVAAMVSTAAFAAGPIRHPAPGPQLGQLVDSNSVGFYSLPPGVRPINSIRRSPMRGARVSFNWRRHGKQQALIGFNSQIQHVVVIYMENRTPENLFGAFWNTMNPSTGNTFGYDLNLVEPESINPPTGGLYPNPLEAQFDPDHSHIPGFKTDVTGSWTLPPTCANLQPCSSTNYPQYSSLSYVPTPAPGSTSRPEVANYISLIENWAYADTVLQSNEGPSFPSHQEAIAGQSGGLQDSSIKPRGEDENPHPGPTPVLTTPIPDDAYIGSGSCFTTNYQEETVNMTTPYPGVENTADPSCAEYPTIFDYMAVNARPIDDVWQYIAKDQKIIWSGPMAVTHLYNQYISGNPPIAQQPFAIDPNAYNFVANLQAVSGLSSPPPSPSPVRPFASLTYITACPAESDHPNFNGVSDGPQWLAYVLNAVVESPYWQNTAVVVTWDDWGGFYDNYQASPWPFHPKNNGYNNPDDPNEWGFRVPLIVISPYVTKRGYISAMQRSQGAILNFVEDVFSLRQNVLNGEDLANQGDDLGDMFNFSNTPLPWVPLPTTFTPPPVSMRGCPHG